MADFNKVGEYLSEIKTFFLATIEGEGTSIRPLGFQMILDNKLYLGIGTHKDAWKQVVANPKVSISGIKADGTSWIRIKGTAVIDEEPEFEKKAFEAAPYLKPMYEENGWTMGIFHLEDGTVTYYENLMAPVATEEF